MTVALRPAVSVDNIDWNFQSLLNELGAVDGATIEAGTIPAVAFAVSYLPLGGGTLSGPLEAPGFTVSGDAVVTEADLADYYTKTEADAALATSAAATTTSLGQVKQAEVVPSLSMTASGTYNAADLQQVMDKLDYLLAKLRAAGVVAS